MGAARQPPAALEVEGEADAERVAEHGQSAVVEAAAIAQPIAIVVDGEQGHEQAIGALFWLVRGRLTSIERA